MIMISNFLFNSTNFYVIDSFLTKLPTLGTLFSTAVRAAVVVAKLVMLGILPLTSFILVLRLALIAKLVMSSIFSSIFFYLSITHLFLNNIIFTTSLSLLK